MEEFILFNEKVTNMVELIETVCSNVLDSNYFMGTPQNDDIDLCDMVKPYLSDEEMKEFDEFLDKL